MVRPPARRAGLVLRTAVWSYLAAVLLVAVLMWTFGDRWWPATTLLFVGRWVFLLPLALLVPAALLRGRALLVPLLLAAGVVVGPIMGFRTGWRTLLPAPAGDPFRVLTFNVAGDRGGGRDVAAFLPLLLDEWDPDVVAVQECGAALADAMAVVAGWAHHREQSLCLLTRHRIVEAAVMPRDLVERLRLAPGQVGGSGLVVRYTLATPAGPVELTNLHLETPRAGFEWLLRGNPAPIVSNTRVRDLESKLARRWVNAGTAAPQLVVGDFNTPVESRIFREHWGDLQDAFDRAGRGFGYTRDNGWIDVRIDHVLAGPAWHVRDARVWAPLGSDHRPLVVDLTLPRR